MQTSRRVFEPIVRDYRKRSYDYWRARIGAEADPIVFGGCTPSGDSSFVEIEAFWDDQSNRNIRVCFVVDDGRVTFINGVAAQFPYSEGFIIEPRGQLVDE